MKILWFFMVISLNGEPTVYHGFPDESDCTKKRNAYASNMSKVTRDVTECIGIPIKGAGHDRRH